MRYWLLCLLVSSALHLVPAGPQGVVMAQVAANAQAATPPAAAPPAAAPQSAAPQAALPQANSRFGAQIPLEANILANAAALTKDGKSGHLRWTPDGRKMLLRSAMGGQCPQIYWLDPLTNERTLASSGKGAVRTAYPLKFGKSWLFDSSQDSGEGPGCPPSNLGSVPAGFNIYLGTNKGFTRLTSSPGFEGDLDVTLEEKRVVFSSSASGDLEIWTMELDGLNKKQLTRAPGYDGDPSFSNDGRRIVFRSNRPRGAAALTRVKADLEIGRANLLPSEIFVMNLNGSDERQITSFGCIVLNPVFTPDNRRIVFSADLPSCQGKTFDLFMINLDGTGLVQLSKTGGFTSEAHFSPDGKRITYTQNGNVFLADWNASPPPAETINPLSKP